MLRPDLAPHSQPASKVVFVWEELLFCGERRGGGLDLPGGNAEPGENAPTCARRELAEEAVVSAEAAAAVAAQVVRPPAAFLMHLPQTCFDASIFVVRLAAPGVCLTEDGQRELATPAWRPAAFVLQDLASSRTPASAGAGAYATALRAALSAGVLGVGCASPLR